MWQVKNTCQRHHRFAQLDSFERRSRCGRAVFKGRAVSGLDPAQQALSLALERARDEHLIQARIGVGERGRGLFFQPRPGASWPPAFPAASAPVASTSASHAGATQPVLLRAPLSAGLTLVAGGGPKELQRELLLEWQAHHELELPGPLAALLLETDRPPALRLAAWLLWVAYVAGPSADGSSTANPSTPLSPPAVPPPPPPQPQPRRPQAQLLSEQQPPHPDQPHAHPQQQQPQQQPPQQQPASAQPSSSGSLLTEYVRSILPPVTAPASCLRLPREGVALLPADARAALAGMRTQVLSYTAELRRRGLDWGCDEATLWWAFDMVTSRGFSATAALPPPPSPRSSPPVAAPAAPAASSSFPPLPSGATPSTLTAVVSLALYMPWACLLNHSHSPNATFSADLAAREFLVVPRLRFTPLEPGVELCISYGGGLDNVRQLLKYGFCTAGNANDRLVLPPEVAAAARGLRRQALCSAAEVLADRLARGGCTTRPDEALLHKTQGGQGSPSGALPGAASGHGLDQQPRRRSGAGGGNGEQWRNRVYAALATLLDPPTEPRACPSSGLTLQAWAAAEMKLYATMANFVAGRDNGVAEEEGTDDPVPDGVLLAECPYQLESITELNTERKLMLDCFQQLIGLYADSLF